MKVPYFDLSQQTAKLRPGIDAAIKRVIDSGTFVLGPEVEAFEREWAAYCGTKHAVAVNSGTAALHLALLGAGVGPGDKVIVPAMSFVATAEAVSHCGATPLFADIQSDTLSLSVHQTAELLEDSIEGFNVKAVVPVHLYGAPANIAALRSLIDRDYPDCSLIEDACQAHGATHHGERAGGLARAAAFSFYPGKNLGAFGEAGIITTSDDALAADARSRRAHGAATVYHHDQIGYNYRMEALQGAILRAKLPYLDGWNASRRAIAGAYLEAFANLPELLLQRVRPLDQSSNHLFVVQHPRAKELREFLAARGVGTSRHYPVPLHLTGAYQHLGYKVGDFPAAERLAREGVSLPIWPEMSLEQIETVIAAVIEFCHQPFST